jgi:hypothetical protein
MQPYLQGRIRRSVANFRTGSHWLEIQRGRFTKPSERENRMWKKYNSGVVEDEAYVVIVCPLYETLRLKYSELFRDESNLNSAFSTAQIAKLCMIAT